MRQSETYAQPSSNQRYVQQQYGEWITNAFRWDLFATLTFSHDLDRDRADTVLHEYLRFIEEELRAPLACVIAQESKRASAEKAPVRVHFHLLIGCAKPLDPTRLVELWKEARFGGDRTDGEPAEVLVFDRSRSPAHYMMKGHSDPNCNWEPWNLHNASKRKPKSFATCSKTRRTWRRNQQRMALAKAASLPNQERCPARKP